MRSSFMHEDKIILLGDLNFLMGHAESWGNHAQVDSLSIFFVHMLESNTFIDIPVACLHLTWRNRRIGDAMLARRLD